MEHVAEFAIVSLRPYLVAVIGAFQLRGDAKMIADLADSPFQHMGHHQLTTNDANVDGVSLERERRGSGRHLHSRHFAEEIEQRLGQAVREILLVFSSALVHERKNRNGMLGNHARGHCYCLLTRDRGG